MPEAQELQRHLAGQVARRKELGEVRLVAGLDLSAGKADRRARGAAVVLEYPGLKVVEVRTAEVEVEFPYIPGLLSFRESPALLAALEKLTLAPDLLFADGQGIAHPRRFGIASHLGLLVGLPTVGCAKSLLCGTHGSVGEEPGSFTELVDGEEVIGAVLRTRKRTSPIYVSIGHKVDLPTAMTWTMRCLKGFRLPEPARLAHLAAAGQLQEGRYDLPRPDCQEKLL